MKRLFVPALSVSVLLNLAFGWIFFGSPEEERPVSARLRLASAPPPSTGLHLWVGIDTDDMPALTARLRAAGFPAPAVRAILREKITQQFASRRRALLPPYASTPFWMNPRQDPRTAVALRQFETEQEKLLADLLGDRSSAMGAHDPDLAFLTPAKAVGIAEIEREHQRQRTELWTAGFTHDTDRAKFAAIDRHYEDALAQLLTPTERREYDLRKSPIAEALRARLAAFEPTEDEFRAIHALRSAFQKEWGDMIDVSMSPERQQLRDEAEERLETETKAALTPERAAYYSRAAEWDYLATSQLVARLELPRETTDRLYSLKEEFVSRSFAIQRAGHPMPDRTAQLTALRDEAIARITPLLGAQAGALEAYQQRGGHWVKYLVPPPFLLGRGPSDSAGSGP